MMQLSPRGAQLIKNREGLRLQAYKDSAGLWTVGYGHLIQPQSKWREYQQITQEQADWWFEQDSKRFVKAVNLIVTVPLSQNQFDALVSLAFNIGVNNFAKSTLVKKLNAKDYAAAALQILVWNKATVNGKLQEIKGLTSRRYAERLQFNSP